MISISKIASNTVHAAKRPLDAFANARILNGFYKNYRKNNVKYIAGIGILSIALKDGLGCYMYVKQSLNNKKIPPDKRKFVAALDLANGGLMILTQVATFFTISNKKVQEKIFDKLFNKFFNRAARKGHKSQLLNIEKFEKLTGKNFYTAFEALKKSSASTFGVITSLVAATILAKRILVPFIATPLAEKTKKYLYGKEGKPAAAEPEVKTAEVKEDKTNKPEAVKPETTNLLESIKNKQV